MFGCKHVPDRKLKGQERVVERVDGCMSSFTWLETYRELVTDHVCAKCGVHFVTKHRIDEISARIGLPPPVDGKKA